MKTSIGLFGCGGIGVEFLHSLLGYRVEELLLVDFDVVEMSNLSRQFIFTVDDIGKSKVEACRRFCQANFPDTRIIALDSHLEVIELRYFQHLSVIIAALDNAEARRVLYTRAIAAGILYIDSGTAGLSGSIRVFKPFSHKLKDLDRAYEQNEFLRPACYCCAGAADPHALPVCTLRQKPETPKHCIAFALALGYGMLGEGELAEVKERGIHYVFDELLKYFFANSTEPEVLRAVEILRAFVPREGFFNRDDERDVEFVHAASWLRARQFAIPYGLSVQETQQIAGRIISAVCFANGLVGAMTVREMLRCQAEFILISKTAPYVRYDELGASSPTCPICSIDTFRVEKSAVAAFIEQRLGAGHYLYNDGKCVKTPTTLEDSGWFDETDENQFKLEEGQFLCAVSHGRRINVIVGGVGCEMCWQGRCPVAAEVDLDDSDDFCVVPDV